MERSRRRWQCGPNHCKIANGEQVWRVTVSQKNGHYIKSENHILGERNTARLNALTISTGTAVTYKSARSSIASVDENLRDHSKKSGLKSPSRSQRIKPPRVESNVKELEWSGQYRIPFTGCGKSSIALASTLVTLPVTLPFFCVPYPTTTTSSKACESSIKTIFSLLSVTTLVTSL